MSQPKQPERPAWAIYLDQLVAADMEQFYAIFEGREPRPMPKHEPALVVDRFTDFANPFRGRD